MEESENRMITILGPTATGKTRLAARLAYEMGGEIVSADSRQVYCRMDIGTGKDIEDYEYQDVVIPYHLIDIVQPGEEYNVFKYQQAAQIAIKNIEQQGKRVILCGGSGMYIEALVKGYKLFPVPEDFALRNELEQQSDEVLIAQLASMRTLHNHTDTCERSRLIHAIMLEKYYLEHPELQTISTAHPAWLFGLCGNRDLIRTRITQRLKERLAHGMVEEVEQLLASGVNAEQLVRYGLEYKFVTHYIQGLIDQDTLFTKLNIAIHQFSKRQMTWFRKMEREGFDIQWIDIAWNEDEKIEFIKSKVAEYEQR